MLSLLKILFQLSIVSAAKCMLRALFQLLMLETHKHFKPKARQGYSRLTVAMHSNENKFAQLT